MEKHKRKRKNGESKNFRMLFAIGFVWMIGSSIWDLALHGQGVAETFFTVAHFGLYSGLLYNIWLWYTYKEEMPPGYDWWGLGNLLFAGFGVGDMIWHVLLGIEKDILALVSPTHMGLLVGAYLIFSSPLKELCMRYAPGTQLTWKNSRLGVLSLFGVSFVIFAQAHYMSQWAANWFAPSSSVSYGFTAELNQAIAPYIDQFSHYSLLPGLAAITFFTFILTGFALTIGRRYYWPFGTWTAFYLSSSLMAGVFYTGAQYQIPLALVSGLIADVVFAKVGLMKGPKQARISLVMVVALTNALQMIVSVALGQNWWSIHALTGTFAFAIATSLLTSVMFMPPWFFKPLVTAEEITADEEAAQKVADEIADLGDMVEGQINMYVPENPDSL